MKKSLLESLRKIIQQEISAAINENSSEFKVGEIYRSNMDDTEYQVSPIPDKYKHVSGAGTMNIWVTNLDTEEKHFIPAAILKKMKQVYLTPDWGNKVLKRYESVNESKVYELEIINKDGKSTKHRLPADSMLDVNRTVEAIKKSKRVSDVKILGIVKSLSEAEASTYTYAHDPKSNKYNVVKVSDGATVTSFSTEDQAKRHVEKINKLAKGYDKIKGKVYEGPEEMGAYRRLVITSPFIAKMKDEFNKFMSRPETKSMYPVRYKVIDSPKANTIVVDVEGDKATVVAIKLSDLAKKLDKSVAIIVRKERKLK